MKIGVVALAALVLVLMFSGFWLFLYLSMRPDIAHDGALGNVIAFCAILSLILAFGAPAVLIAARVQNRRFLHATAASALGWSLAIPTAMLAIPVTSSIAFHGTIHPGGLGQEVLLSIPATIAGVALSPVMGTIAWAGGKVLDRRVAARAHLADASTTAEGPQSVEYFIETYYLDPSPERIAGMIPRFVEGGLLDTDTSPFVGFLAEVLRANPDRRENWIEVIRAQPKRAQPALHNASALADSGGVLAASGHDPSLNDLYWGGFFATGSPKMIDRLLEEALLAEVRSDVALFLVGGSAKWSLASNARQHGPVRQILLKARDRAEGRLHALLDEVLTRDPNEIRDEIGAIYRSIQTAPKR